ncbi:MAG: glycosyltransferase family 4 protein [Abditibacteriales bacterium]|nr:glycosyltransferase family 4 protein [Abditibacteriales bacterium]MDW8368317.1 glycosyltransferase family 4 protein [Abditibacteriales bacterium]
MKVAMVTGAYPPVPCGIGDYTQRLCNALREQNVDVTVWTLNAARRGAEWTWGAVKRIAAEIAAAQPDLVHMQYPGKGYGHRLAPTFLPHVWRRKGNGAPLVVTLHEFRIAHPLRKCAALNLIRAADALIVPAWCEQQSLMRFWKKSPIAVIPPSANIPVQPVTPERRRERRTAWNVKDDDVLLCHFGFVQRNKGFTRLLNAFEEAHRKVPHLKLLLIGDYVSSPQASLISVGYLPAADVSESLSAADVGVLPYSDGVSARRTTFWTALQHGLPVITTRDGSEPETMGLRHAENVYLVAANGSPTELRDAILTVADSPALRQKLSANGRALGSTHTWDNIARRTLEVYERVTSE